MLEKYLLITILTSLGTVLGLILSKIAPEELTQARPYLIRLQDALFLIAILILTYYNLTNLLILLLVAFLIFYWYKETAFKKSYIIEFIILGIMFGIGYSQNTFYYVTPLIFIYAISSNILLAGKYLHRKQTTIYKLTFLRILYFTLGSLIVYGNSILQIL